MARRTSLRDLLDKEPEVLNPPKALPVHNADLKDLASNPDNPRPADDPEVQELAASITQIGQLQAAVVVSRDVFLRHCPQHEQAVGKARWVVINGNRRLAAARLAGLTRLDISVKDHLGDEGGVIDEAVMVENIHRRQLDPIREAQFLQRLVERHRSQRAVATRIGKTQGYVSQRLSLLKLHPALQERITCGALPIEDARELAALAPETQLATWQQRHRDPAGDYAVISQAASSDGAQDEQQSPARRVAAPKIPSQKTAARVLARYKAAHGADAVANLIRGELNDVEAVAVITSAALSLGADALDELLRTLSEVRARI
jgi:ParB/RepB/Spo0J family partition protein